MSNALLMREGLNLIEADQMGWDQTAWRKCFAAKVAEAAGAEFVQLGNSLNTRSEWYVRVPDTGRILSVRSYAQELLELDPEEFEVVVAGERTLEELRHIVGLYELREQAHAVGDARTRTNDSARHLVRTLVQS